MTTYKDRPKRCPDDDVLLSEDGSQVVFYINPGAFPSFKNTGYPYWFIFTL